MAADTQRSAENSLQIILIGSTGSGKSSTGNTILRNKRFKSEACGKSVTLNCASVTEKIFGKQVTVVDTPGWDCTELSEQEFVTAVQKALKNLQEPYSFLLVLRIGGVESDDIDKIYKLEKVLGTSFLEHTTILFSHSDDLEYKTFQEFLDEGGEEFQALLKRCSHRCHSWNNRSKISDEDLNEVLQDLKKTETKQQHSEKSSHGKIRKEKVEPQFEQKENCGKRPSEQDMEVEDAQEFYKPEDKHSDQRHAKGLSQPTTSSAEQKENCGKRTREQDMEVEDAQESANPIRVLFLGMTKVGKTSSIKTLQRKGEQTSKDIYKFSKNGLSLQLCDSPGFDEDPREIQKVISDTVSSSKPHVIIIMMSVDRFSPAVKRTMQNVQHVLGGGATKHTMILFSGKDNLEDKPLDAFIEENTDLKEMVKKMNGSRVYAFNNRDARDHRQVNEVLQTIARMYRANEGEFYKPEDKHSDQRHAKGKSQPTTW